MAAEKGGRRVSYHARTKRTYERAKNDDRHDPVVAFKSACLTTMAIAAEADAEARRREDQVQEMREIISDLISGARRDRSIISRKAGPLHVIETRVTKGQVLRAMAVFTMECD